MINPADSVGLDVEARAGLQLPTLSGERFRIVGRLGSGGMGTVYRARDSRLDRDVALKILHPGHPEALARFVHEARAQAKVDHPNVCKVYDAGMIEDRPFIAMQLIEGVPLSDAAATLHLEKKVLLIKLVAEGIHAAHKQGLIHRDVKPANILIEKREDGLWPVVLDFGLARETEEPRLTVAGFVAGTPAYMSPEQVRADVSRMDRRTDVYGLGATLYECLAGKPAFEGASAIETMMKVVSEDPRPLTTMDSQIPRDLDAIVLKCLEKEPSRRYDSARALAEDLARFLNGEPVKARPISVPQRLLRRAKRHRALTIVSCAGLLSALVLGSLFIRSEIRTARRMELTRQFTQEIKDIEWFMRVASFAPRHDTTSDIRSLSERVLGIERRIHDLSASDRGPGHHALGRAYLAMGDADRALQQFRTAETHGALSPDLSFGIAVAASEVYKRKIEETLRIRDSGDRERRRAEVEKEYRGEILTRLKESRRASLQGPEYLEGLIAVFENRFEEARALANTTLSLRPWDVDARLLLAESHLAEALIAQSSAGVQKARRAADSAAREFEAAAEAGRSDIRAYAGKARALQVLARIELYSKGGASLKKAAIDCVEAAELALTVRSGYLPALLILSAGYGDLADYLFQSGEDPRPSMEKAVEAAGQILRKDSDNAEAFLNLASLHWIRGKYEGQLGLDSRPAFGKAVEAARRAMEVKPGSADRAETIMGLALLDQSIVEHYLKVDSLPSLERAISCFESRLREGKESLSSLVNLSLALQRKGDVLLDRRGDAGPEFERALDLAEKAATSYPEHAFGHLAALEAASAWSNYLVEKGKDPAAAVTRARGHFDAGARVAPSQVRFPYSMALAYLAAAQYWAKSDPRKALGEIRMGKEMTAKAREINPGISQVTWLGKELETVEKSVRPR